MWSMFDRGRVFTAMNRTTNRIESHWNQYKLRNGKKRRIDTCIQTIFLQAISSLRREAELFGEHLVGGQAYATAPPFLRRVLTVLSKYVATLVLRQWAKYLSIPPRTSLVERLETDDVIVLRVTGLRTVDFTVDTSVWSYTCHYYCGGHLPCKHLIFAAREVKGLAEYPRLSIPVRWRMTDAAHLVSVFKKAVDELETLTTMHVEPAATKKRQDPGVIPGLHIPTFKSVETVRLRRGEHSSTAVMTDLQKRAAIMTILDPLITMMMAQGTHVFASRLLELDPAITDLMSKFEATGHRPSLCTSSDADEERQAGGSDTLQRDTSSSARTAVVDEPSSHRDYVDNQPVECTGVRTEAEEALADFNEFVGADLDDDGIDMEECGAFLATHADDDEEIQWDEDDTAGDDLGCHQERYDNLDMGVYESSQSSSFFPSQNSLLLSSQVSSEPMGQPPELLSPVLLEQSDFNMRVGQAS